MRVFCLSELDDSVLMWSHYADQHQGVVLGFDTEAMEQGFTLSVGVYQLHE